MRRRSEYLIVQFADMDDRSLEYKAGTNLMLFNNLRNTFCSNEKNLNRFRAQILSFISLLICNISSSEFNAWYMKSQEGEGIWPDTTFGA